MRRPIDVKAHFVASAAAIVELPFSGFGGASSFEIESRAKLPGDPGLMAMSAK